MSHNLKRFLVTGANGFIGKNLTLRLEETPGVSLVDFSRGDDPNRLHDLLRHVDAVFHLAGENRPVNEQDFETVNSGLTRQLCDAISKVYRETGRRIPLVFTSSVQAELDNAYGRSKFAGENAVRRLSRETGNPCFIYRLPGVFGKWCRPNYNSVVATFCNNIARGLPISISDPEMQLRLVYIDDVVSSILASLEGAGSGLEECQVAPEYKVSLGDLAISIKAFGTCRASLDIARVGTGFLRALYSTYVSYLPSSRFSYPVPQHTDPRGVFVEMLKTSDSGQFSYFTAHPGVTRGGHYHHTKSEKFLVISGEALFRFRHLVTDESVELRTSGGSPEVVDTIPGWTHDITNVGDKEMVVMLWANEVFDRSRPDTIPCKV